MQRRSPFTAILLITIGIFFLLTNFHLIDATFWSILVRFWPVILIMLGIQAVFGKTRLTVFLLFLIGLATIGLAVLASATGNLKSQTNWHWLDRIHSSEQSFNYVLGPDTYLTATSRKVHLENSLGKVTVSDTDRGELLEYHAGYQDSKPEVSDVLEGTTAIIDLQSGDHLGFGSTDSQSTRFVLGRPGLPTDLNLENSAGETDLNLTQTRLSALTLQTGAGSMHVTLNERSLPEKASIEIGAGSLTIHLPKNAGLKITHDISLGQLKIDDKKMSGQGDYSTDNYDRSLTKVTLDIQVGTGTVTIVRD